MSPRKKPGERPIESRALAVLREARGWKKNRLATVLELQPGTYYDYESGTAAPSRSLLERAADAMGYPASQVDRTLAYLRQSDLAAAAVGGPGQPEAEADGAIERIATSLALEAEAFHRIHLKRTHRLSVAFAERQAARVHWPRLRAHSPAERPAVLRETPEFQSWAVAEQICHESIEAAAEDADEAVELARLAELAASLITGDDAWCSRIRGYAAFHVGNALRVKGNLPNSDEAFHRAAARWKAGAAGDPEGLLDEARVLGLEASLRRAQRRLPEALDLLDRALAVDRSETQRGRLLVKRAKTLEEMGQHEEAIATLRRALPLIDSEREPRLLRNLLHNLVVNLCAQARFSEAEPLLKILRKAALQDRRHLNLVRLVWLEGRIAAGLGRPAEAVSHFEQVRREFLAKEIDFDAALVSLELAVLYLEQEHTSEVKTISRELAPVFVAQRVSREALATLKLFREAVEKEAITAELARRLLNDLRASRQQEDL